MAERCIIIPVYNHAAGIRATLARLADVNMSCIVVDDGSGADCAAAIDEVAGEANWVEVVRHAENRGKGAAVKTALMHAHQRGFSHALQIDADEQHDVRDIPALVSASERDPDAVVLGVPQFDDTVPKLRLFSRYLTHVWVWINTLSFAIRDAMCGFRIYPVPELADLIRSAKLGDRMEFDIEVLVALHWRGARFANVPVRTVYPENGVSHFRLLDDNWRISRMHARCFFAMLGRLPGKLVRG